MKGIRTRVERTAEATTAHGTVEYEVVECCSCGNDTKKDQAKRIVVGELRSQKDWRALGKREYEFNTGTITDGYVCEYCANDPAGMPEGSIRQTVSQIEPLLILISVLAFALIMLILATVGAAVL